MATVTLGNIKFNWKGPYNNSTAYVVDDVVSSGGSSYVCILASTGNAVSNGTYWQQMSAAGTNGTDLTSTLTTQGDIVYRDGSGLQRLAKGTASQVLQMNTSANAPEWANASGGYVLQEKVGMYHGNTTTSYATTTPTWLGSINTTYSTASSITMTPASAASKFEIYMQTPIGNSGYGHILLYRNINNGSYTQLTGGKHIGNGQGDPYNLLVGKYWDAPNTTYAVNYKIYAINNDSTSWNLNDTGQYNSMRGGIILSVKEVDGSKLTIST